MLVYLTWTDTACIWLSFHGLGKFIFAFHMDISLVLATRNSLLFLSKNDDEGRFLIVCDQSQGYILLSLALFE